MGRGVCHINDTHWLLDLSLARIQRTMIGSSIHLYVSSAPHPQSRRAPGRVHGGGWGVVRKKGISAVFCYGAWAVGWGSTRVSEAKRCGQAERQRETAGVG